jgi:hypothetical protein
VVTTTPMNARKGYSTITTYKLGKSNYLAFIFLAIYNNNTKLCVIFISLCFGFSCK